ncbi:MAG: type I-U CRISPR-associated protein Cas5/Cas6 [Deltaproteobacteria bacterium]|nr:type I-U CRISPR-associated protein Cas5/Cas6 [Deltaproteobacteria bacterium]
MFIAEVAFPSGRFCGASFETPDHPEWPPHPSRFFSAMVASACMNEGMTDPKRQALKWLEEQDPPAIHNPPADSSPMLLNFVPPGDFNVQKGKVEDPFRRIRKERYFPQAYILQEPILQYVWDKEPPQDFLKTLDEIALGVTHIGSSHSMSLVRVRTGSPNGISFRPQNKGSHFFRATIEGRLEELTDQFYNSIGVRRPTATCEVLIPYKPEIEKSTICESPFKEFHVFRLPGLSHGAESSESLARAVRRAVMSCIPDPIPEVIHGHVPGPHVGWIPLCDVGHQNARGRITGMALAIPRGGMAESRSALFAALARLRERGIKLDDGRDVYPEPLTPEYQVPRSLDRLTWTRTSRVWASVTPVIPDRLPKKRTALEASRSVADSLLRAGFPKPETVEVSPFSVCEGAPSILSYHLRLPRFHATVRFSEPVSGPVVAGRRRYFGVGLFRPLWDES